MPGSLRVCVITPFGGISIGLYASWMLRFFPVFHSFSRALSYPVLRICLVEI